LQMNDVITNATLNRKIGLHQQNTAPRKQDIKQLVGS
jgi:hypothetical protein